MGFLVTFLLVVSVVGLSESVHQYRNNKSPVLLEDAVLQSDFSSDSASGSCSLGFEIARDVSLKDALARLGSPDWSKTLVAYDFDLTLKASVFIGKEAKGPKKAVVRGGEESLALVKELQAKGARQVVISAAAPSQISYETVKMRMEDIGVADLFDLPAKGEFIPMLDGSKAFVAGDVYLPKYSKDACIELARKKNGETTILFLDDFVVNAFNVASFYVGNGASVTDKPSKLVGIWLDPQPLIDAKQIHLTGLENSRNSEYKAYVCVAEKDTCFSDMSGLNEAAQACMSSG
uniref:Uncharacterized protein n=1 Tax=Chromera velia CCMP2878 TaxID=1169474 RepID=A0A0G4HNA6_9ALVE|eukprot:Cvel_7594.t1-p1 / transcript=Cvel_7594.t1 / gene=Cvel_7594 / organism=Chromera_velia_CCMP2878 / gene_product=hypothetical protein / transcript_product=hypothetical protein / location=Cvel_scaffold400:21985-23635(-) / protein_length=290 / sequence_SO=supercontig / SO=protein_coding / is_pseudo=false